MGETGSKKARACVSEMSFSCSTVPYVTSKARSRDVSTRVPAGLARATWRCRRRPGGGGWRRKRGAPRAGDARTNTPGAAPRIANAVADGNISGEPCRAAPNAPSRDSVERMHYKVVDHVSARHLRERPFRSDWN